METIQVDKKIKEEFEKDRFALKNKEHRLVTQSEFLGILIKDFREGKRK